MGGARPDYYLYLRDTAERVQRTVQNPFAKKAVQRAANTGSLRAVDAVGRLLEHEPFSSEERMYRLYRHFGGAKPRAESTRLLNEIIIASGERVEQVLEQIEIMCARNMPNQNAEQRLEQILDAVRSDRVFPDLAVADLRRRWETPTP
ncbi:MAG: hypothetical protein ACPL06_01145 [Candidatus Anstonellales archaeon]